MSDTPAKAETRGRPRKNTEQRLPPISRKLFSQHCAVFYACCMVYVLEVFLKTKTEKRIGHSEGGFTLYEKLNPTYCFETLEEDLREWGYDQFLQAHPGLADFLKTVNGCAPRFVFRELVALVVGLAQALMGEGAVASGQQLQVGQVAFLNVGELELNRKFKYLRFSPAALRELKMEKWAAEVGRKIRDLWRPFLKIVSYTVLGVLRGTEKSKYLRPFFSDAEHPEDTIIGQLNLEQIVDERQREEREKEERPSPATLGFTKILKLESGREEERRVDFNNSPSTFADRPLQNRRPITLITFPSNTQIETNNPFKQKTSVGINVDTSELNAEKQREKKVVGFRAFQRPVEDGEAEGELDPRKRLKTE